jgi:hypothetical protein
MAGVAGGKVVKNSTGRAWSIDRDPASQKAYHILNEKQMVVYTSY